MEVDVREKKKKRDKEKDKSGKSKSKSRPQECSQIPEEIEEMRTREVIKPKAVDFVSSFSNCAMSLYA